jgi:hypothetical protein
MGRYKLFRITWVHPRILVGFVLLDERKKNIYASLQVEEVSIVSSKAMHL